MKKNDPYIKPMIIESLPFDEEGDSELTIEEMLDEAQDFKAKSKFIDGMYQAMNEFEDKMRKEKVRILRNLGVL